MPQTLVETVATLANAKNITHSGENALTITNASQKYQNCAQMLFNYGFSSFSLLRIDNVVNSDGSATSEISPFASALALNPVPVTFTVSGANTSYGQNVYLTGSRWEIGNWTTGSYAFPLSYSNGNWVGTIYLAQGVNYQFKAIKKDSSGNVTWEGGSNHTYTVPTGGGSDSYAWTN